MSADVGSVPRRTVGAWQAALAAEFQASFGYALLGPQLSGAPRRLAFTCAGAHRSLSDTTISRLVAAGRTPVEPHADYPALYPVPDATAAVALAARLEDECAAAWRYLYFVAAAPQRAAGSAPHPASVRTAAQAALSASAVRATRWRLQRTPGQATTAFPGIG